MDISSHFKACVKTCSFYDKIVYNSRNKKLKPTKRSISEFSAKAQKITFQIEKLYTLLVENRQVYLNLYNHFERKCSINDIDREEMDIIAQNIISICFQLTNELRKNLTNSDVSEQYREHKKIIIFLIDEYLKQVCKIYSEQKAIRLKSIIEHKKLSKLDSNLNKNVNTVHDKVKFISYENNENESDSLKVQEINGDMNIISYHEDELLSPEDIQIFECENEQLYNELTVLTEEVKQIETKVIHITELQDLFTQRVLEQNKDLDHVFTTVVGSTENVKEANEHIRKAIQRNAGLRVWILLFLLVMSFTLIFLDWYNP